MCLDDSSKPTMVWGSNPGSECLGPNPDNEIFYFIKISAQIRNNFSKF